MVDFAVVHHLPHQCHGLVGNGETHVRKAGQESRHPQHPHRILDESR